MRPGQSCPGVVPGMASSYDVAPCFNEAGAIMPRSGESPTRIAFLRQARFNEAGAIMPRSGLDRHYHP